MTQFAKMDAPGTTIVGGVSPLRGLCRSLGVERLLVDGEIMAGAPASLLQGGIRNVTVPSRIVAGRTM
jgi:hypothetical protein